MSTHSRRTRTAAVLAVVLVLVSGACTRKSVEEAGRDIASTTTVATSGPGDGGGAGGAASSLPGSAERIDASALTCFSAPTSAAGAGFDESARTTVPCTQSHNQEQFVLGEGAVLDDCFRVLGASGAITVGTDRFDPSEPAVDDSRIDGHSLVATGTSVTCTFDLAEPASEPVIAR